MSSENTPSMSRRDFVRGLLAAGGAATMSFAQTQQESSISVDYSRIRGFNYQPSYGSSGFEIWQRFDAKTSEIEVGRGKRYFPKMNALRIWLSWDSFRRDPARFAVNFDAMLGIAAKNGTVVMPVLFNRWHDAALDYGGIYLDHFVPGTSWMQSGNMFASYLEAIVGKHAADPRIFAWDLCNEPFSYGCSPKQIPDIVKAEFGWLKDLHDTCKKLGAKAPITVGIHQLHGRQGIKQIEPISDLLSIHPYWTADSPPHDKGAFERSLDSYVDFAGKVNKPLLATETCWGALDDKKRTDIIRYTLGQLKQRNIGWLVYLLHHSLIADAHRPKFGPTGAPGNLAFIEADGTLRPGHDIFNSDQRNKNRGQPQSLSAHPGQRPVRRQQRIRKRTSAVRPGPQSTGTPTSRIWRRSRTARPTPGVTGAPS